MISPQAVSGPKDDKKERVLWARFESCDTLLGSNGRQGNTLLLILGLANGITAWMVTVSGNHHFVCI